MGWSGLTNAKSGRTGPGNLDTPPQRGRNAQTDRRFPLRRTMGLPGRTIADERGEAGRAARAKRLGKFALLVPL